MPPGIGIGIPFSREVEPGLSCLVLSINLIHCGNEFRNSVEPGLSCLVLSINLIHRGNEFRNSVPWQFLVDRSVANVRCRF